MDARLAVLVAGIGLLGFLFYPRPELPASEPEGVWVTTARKIDGEPPRFPVVQRADPVVATVDLGFVYEIDRVDITFDNATDNGPKYYEVLVSPTRAGTYRRAFAWRSASRFYPYTIQTFANAHEARWVQVAVTDWFSGKPAVKGIRAGPLYRRDWNPIRSVTTSHNEQDAPYLIDGRIAGGQVWSGAERVKVTTEKDGKRTTETQLRTPKSDAWVLLDLGARQRVYGTRVTVVGPGNCPKSYRVEFSDDGRSFEPIHTSGALADETRSYVHRLPEPLQTRFMRVLIPEGAWYGRYAELREVEVFTDAYRLRNTAAESMADYTPVAVAYDNCGVDLRRSPNLTTGYVFDRGGEVTTPDRFGWRTGDDIDREVPDALTTFAYHYDGLRFHYSDLSADRLYWIQVTYLQNKSGGRSQNLIADGFLLHADEVTIPSGEPKAMAFHLPAAAYADGEVAVQMNRLAGPNAVVSEVTLFEARPSGVGDSPSQSRASGRAIRASGPIAIDGELDDWADVAALTATGGISDATAWLQWDDDALYLAMSVPRRSLPSGAALMDTLDVFIDSANTRSPTTYRRGDVHLRFFRFGSGNEVPRYVRHFSDEEAGPAGIPPVEHRGARSGDRYVLEAKLPRAGLLDAWRPQSGAQFGMNYILTTRDGRRSHWVASSPDDAPSRWGPVRLVGPVRSDVRIDVANPSSGDPSAVRAGVERMYAGDILWLVVRDPDANRSPSVADSVAVLLETDSPAAQRRVLLTERDANALYDASAKATDSEYFSAALPTRLSMEVGSNEAALSVIGSSEIRIRYEDSLYEPPNQAGASEAAATVITGVDGTIAARDSEGNSVAVLFAGRTVRIRVVDTDLESEIPSGDGPREAVVTVSSRAGDGGAEDVAKVILTESEPGVFDGELRTAYGEEPVADDALQVTGDREARVLYDDRVQASGATHVPVEMRLRVAIGATALMRLRTPGGKFAPSMGSDILFRAGTPLIVRVEDSDLNRDPGAVEYAEATATAETTGDTATVRLVESGPDSIVFEGILRTSYATAAIPDNETLEVGGGERVNVEYTDRLLGSGATDVPLSMGGSTMTGADGMVLLVSGDYVKPVSRFNAGDALFLRVIEADDIDEPARVVVSGGLNGDREEIPLARSAVAAGDFVGSVPTTYSDSPTAMNGILEVRGSEEVTATYVDALRKTGESDVSITATARANTGTDGILALARIGRTESGSTTVTERIRAGDTLVLEVRDDDLNALSLVIEQTTVTVRDEATGDAVEVTLRETSGNSAVFRGEVVTEFGTPRSDELLQVTGESRIVVTYLDAINAAGKVQQAVRFAATTEVGFTGKVEVLTQDGLRPIGSIGAGETVRIRVTDADLNADPRAADAAQVTISGNVANDSVRLPLSEIGADTGVFEALLVTAFAAKGTTPDSGDLLLEVADKEVLDVEYRDQLTSRGEPDAPVVARAVVAGSSPGSLLIVDDEGREIADFVAGSTLHVWLDDLLLTTLSEATSARVAVSSERTGDTVDVVLAPVSGESGKFVGTLPTRYSPSPIPDGTLDVQGGDDVRATYRSVLPDVFRVQVTDTARVRTGTRAKVTLVNPDGSEAPVVLPGSPVHVRIEDADANADRAVPDRIRATVGVQGGVTRTVDLVETGPGTGVFRGDVDTTLGARTDSPTALPLRGGETVTATYRDPIIDTGEAGLAVSATCVAVRVGRAPFTSERVLVDGIADRWPLENVLTVGDGEALVWSQWSRDALFLFVRIRDDEVTVQDVTRWYQGSDAVEIYIDTEPEASLRSSRIDRAAEGTRFAFWFCPKGGGIYGEKPYVGQLLPTRKTNVSPPVGVAAREDEDGYVLEIAIPFRTALPGFDPITSTRRDRIGLNFLVHRSDAPQAWWAEPLAGVLPSTMGMLYLQRPETLGGAGNRVTTRTERKANPAP